jgi:hypothetical protein
MPEAATEVLLYALPWLRLREPLAFGAVELAPATMCLDDDHPCTHAAWRALGCYKDMGGHPVPVPSLMWVTGRGPLDVDERDHPKLERHRMCLAAGLIAGNEYFAPYGLGAITSAHCDGYLHRVSADGAHMGVYKRRREGMYLDGWPLDRLTITVPLAASAQHQVPFVRDLLDTLVDTAEGTTELGGRLARALPPFLQGNSVSYPFQR